MARYRLLAGVTPPVNLAIGATWNHTVAVQSTSASALPCLLALPQVSAILNRATSRSLVLLDEFGKGTLTTDGVGLLAAILEHYAMQTCPPFVLACTHFHELLDPEILPAHPQIQHCTIQVGVKHCT